MCESVPYQVIKISDGWITLEADGGIIKEIKISWVFVPDLKVGDDVLLEASRVTRKIDPVFAEELRSLNRMMQMTFEEFKQRMGVIIS